MSQHSLSGRTVCIVDDDELVRQMMSLNLREQGITVLEASTGPELYDVMGRDHLDCILMDYDLASETGLFVQDQLRQKFADVPPVIMLTGVDNQRTIIKAFRTGVHDYLLKKGLRLEELMTSLRSAIDRRAEEEALKAELGRLKKTADIDDVTGLYRRESMETMLASLIESSQRAKKPFAVIMVRLNEFEDIKVQAGQVSARRVLAAFATLLRKTLRPADVCGRWDDNSFVYVIDRAANRQQTDAVVTGLNNALRFNFQVEAQGFEITADFGAAFFPADGASPESLIGSARNSLGPASLQLSGQPGSEEVADTGPTVAKERRAHARQRVFKGGQIVTNAGRSILDCTVRDLSAGGARLRLKAAVQIPERFELHILGSGEHQPARLAWQKGIEVGVEFVDRTP